MALHPPRAPWTRFEAYGARPRVRLDPLVIRVVWWVNWELEQVHIYTPDSIEALTRPHEVLSGGEVLPGFKCRLSRIFHLSG